jgi:hypothetical protein
VEEDGELARNLHGGHRRRMVAAVVVRRLVADPAKIMEQVEHLARQIAVAPKPTKELGLRLLDAHEQAETRGELLRQELAELAQLHQAGDRVLGEVLLGPGGDRHQRRVVGGEKAEIRGPRQVGRRLHLSREMEQAGSRPCKRVSCAGDRTGDRNANFCAGTPTQYVVRSTG